MNGLGNLVEAKKIMRPKLAKFGKESQRLVFAATDIELIDCSFFICI